MLLYSIIGSFIAGMLVIYYPPLQEVFHTKALDANGLFLALLVGLSTTVFLEAGKYVIMKKKNNGVLSWN